MTASPGQQKIPLVITRGYLVRRGAMIGAALGMLVGLIYNGFGPELAGEHETIIRWRNFILAGTAIGLVAGILWPKPAPPEWDVDEHD